MQSTRLAYAALAFTLVTPTLSAGNLNPPPGAVAPTDRKILSQATTPLPLTISQPGNYVLTSDLVGGAGNGIEVTADDVVIDLNGFSLIGSPNSTNGVIDLDQEHNGFVIKNGTIRNWPERALEITELVGARCENLTIHSSGNGLLGGRNAVVTNVTVRGSSGAGIYIPGGGSITDCAVSGCFVGIQADRGATVTNCTAQECQVGFQYDTNSVFTNCAATDCGDGFQGDSGGVLRGCLAASNGVGFIGDAGNSYTDCAARNNVLAGFAGGGGDTTLTNCTSIGNGTEGFRIQGPSRLEGCLASQNGETGIYLLGAQGEAVRCTATSNGSGGGNPGIRTEGDNAVVSGCTVTGNAGRGVWMEGPGAVCVGNTSQNNSDDGITIDNDGGRIEGNHSSGNNASGFAIYGARNLIIRNSAGGNLGFANYFISNSNNVIGPIVDQANIATSGSPHANYEQ